MFLSISTRSSTELKYLELSEVSISLEHLTLNMPELIDTSQPIGQIVASIQAQDPNLALHLSQTSDFSFRSTSRVDHLLTPGPINIGGVEWNFEWHQGVRSLARRGFYKIVGNLQCRMLIDRRTNERIPTWSADVLYCPGHDHHHKYFKFLANVGPLINNHGIGLNTSNIFQEQVISSKLPDGRQRDKQAFFQSMTNRVFYVSQQLYIETYYKQTVWFLFRLTNRSY